MSTSSTPGLDASRKNHLAFSRLAILTDGTRLSRAGYARLQALLDERQ